MNMARIWVLLFIAGLCPAQDSPTAAGPVTADAIMARVAVNQDSSELLRKQYVYKQHIHIVTHKPRGRLMREETADYDVVPTPEGTEKQLKQLTGRYWFKGKYKEFDGEPVPDDDSVDAGLIQDFRDSYADAKSKDGLARNLFPLTTAQQADYDFKLLGREVEQGRDVYHIAFTPKDKDEFTWAGEAYIDATDFQPLRVFTRMSRPIPLMVRTLLGTNLPGLGFNVVYKRQPDGVWFPATLGTEFRIRVLFFLNRDVSISLENSSFEHTHVQTRIIVLEPVH